MSWNCSCQTWDLAQAYSSNAWDMSSDLAKYQYKKRICVAVIAFSTEFLTVLRLSQFMKKNKLQFIFFWSCNKRFYSTRKKTNHLPSSWRPVLNVMPEQQQASWCGLSFPLSWFWFSSTVCHSVGKTSVKGTGGSVHLSLLVGHDFYFDLSAGQPLDCLEGSSTTGSFCQPQSFGQHLFG